MKKYLLGNGYLLDNKKSIWVQSSYESINYSDGDAVEQRIYHIVQEATDLSVLSLELRQHCTDWPSTYHLSANRANLLRPFEAKLKGADVLEIGAGCGAITRYLGEIGSNVLALEGTVRRASIARARTRDLQNIEVLADTFSKFRITKKFDFVTLIGVLEYANLFMPGETPAKTMLERAFQFLKPNGSLILAIENQLGLKYFAGANEDHVSKPMYGIEDRYQSNQVQTFGRVQLERMLVESGFNDVNFYASFPDYKLPCSIISEIGFETESFDAAALACQSVHKDPQLPVMDVFCQELAWPVIVKNKLGMDLSNSFLVLASPQKTKKENKEPLAWHFSTARRREYCKETRFLLVEKDMQVEYKVYGEKDTLQTENLLTFRINDKQNYIQGVTLHYEFIRALTRRDADVNTLIEFFKRYIAIIEKFIFVEAPEVGWLQIDTVLPGEFFDCLPQNIIQKEEELYYVDNEWEANFKLEAGYLAFRALLYLFYQVPRSISNVVLEGLNCKDFIFLVMKESLGWELSESQWTTYVKQEVAVQSEVTGSNLLFDQFHDWIEKSIFQYRPNLYQAVAERDVRINSLHQAMAECEERVNSLYQAVAERDIRINTLNQAVAECEERVNSLNQAVLERDEEINSLHEALVERDRKIQTFNEELLMRNGELVAILNSTSWRVTQPLRWLGWQARRVFRILRKIRQVI